MLHAIRPDVRNHAAVDNRSNIFKHFDVKEEALIDSGCIRNLISLFSYR